MGRTIDFLLVDVLKVFIFGIARQRRLLEWIVQIVVLRYQAIEQAGATIVAPLSCRLLTARGQIRWVQYGGVRVILIEVHGGVDVD